MNVVPRSTGNTNSGTRELTLKCKFRCYLNPWITHWALALGKGNRELHEAKKNVALKVARSDFWVTIPFNFERLEHHHYQSNRKSNVSGVLEKDESFKWGKFHQDLSYHSNEMTPCHILHMTECNFIYNSNTYTTCTTITLTFTLYNMLANFTT